MRSGGQGGLDKLVFDSSTPNLSTRPHPLNYYSIIIQLLRHLATSCSWRLCVTILTVSWYFWQRVLTSLRRHDDSLLYKKRLPVIRQHLSSFQSSVYVWHLPWPSSRRQREELDLCMSTVTTTPSTNEAEMVILTGGVWIAAVLVVPLLIATMWLYQKTTITAMPQIHCKLRCLRL